MATSNILRTDLPVRNRGLFEYVIHVVCILQFAQRHYERRFSFALIYPLINRKKLMT